MGHGWSSFAHGCGRLNPQLFYVDIIYDGRKETHCICTTYDNLINHSLSMYFAETCKYVGMNWVIWCYDTFHCW